MAGGSPRHDHRERTSRVVHVAVSTLDHAAAPCRQLGDPGIGQGVRGLHGMGAIRRDHRGINRSSVRVAGCEVDNREPASVPHWLNSPRHYGLCVRRRIGPRGPPVLVTREVRVIAVRSGASARTAITRPSQKGSPRASVSVPRRTVRRVQRIASRLRSAHLQESSRRTNAVREL